MKNEEEIKKETKKKTASKGTETKKTDATKKKQTAKGTSKKKTENKKATSTGKLNKKDTIEESIKEEVIVEKIEKQKDKSSNKKSDIFLILGLVVVVILGCVLMWGKKPVPTYELPLTLSGDPGLHQLTYQEYQEKVDSGEEFVIILERATCSHCVNFMPVAEAFANDYSVPMYYVDTDTFTDEDWNGFESSNSYLKGSNGNWGTPTTLVLAGSEAVDYIEGETTADNLLNLYNEYFDMGEE